VAFPYSATVRFKFPAQKSLPAFELYWYDGGMKPNIPDEMDSPTAELPAEGMLIVGDKGKILAGFNSENPKLIPQSRMNQWLKGGSLPPEKRDMQQDLWIDAFLNKRESPGSFLLAGAVTETILLGAAALRSGRRLMYDSAAMSITNAPELNKYFRREYRPGWEI
jgi:hypothetical protein